MKCVPDQESFVSAIEACAHPRDIKPDVALRLVETMQERGLELGSRGASALAILLVRHGRPEGALDLLRRSAADGAPAGIDAYEAVARAMARAGDSAAAQEAVRAAHEHGAGGVDKVTKRYLQKIADSGGGLDYMEAFGGVPTPPVHLEYAFLSGPHLNTRATYWPRSDGGAGSVRKAIESSPSLVDSGASRPARARPARTHTRTRSLSHTTPRGVRVHPPQRRRTRRWRRWRQACIRAARAASRRRGAPSGGRDAGKARRTRARRVCAAAQAAGSASAACRCSAACVDDSERGRARVARRRPAPARAQRCVGTRAGCGCSWRWRARAARCSCGAARLMVIHVQRMLYFIVPLARPAAPHTIGHGYCTHSISGSGVRIGVHGGAAVAMLRLESFHCRRCCVLCIPPEREAPVFHVCYCINEGLRLRTLPPRARV